MKAVCPVCGREGVVEQRGNSVRIVHYSWVNGKRVFMKHTVKKGTETGTWEQRLGTVNALNSVFHENQRGCRLAWSRLGDLGSLSAMPCALCGKDPGSNPGSPTINLLKAVCFWLCFWFRAC